MTFENLAFSSAKSFFSKPVTDRSQLGNIQTSADYIKWGILLLDCLLNIDSFVKLDLK